MIKIKAEKPKLAKKEKAQIKVQKTVIEPLKKYHLAMKFNDQVFESETDDLQTEIMSARPTNLKTKVLFTITDNETGKVCEKLVFVFKARQIFRNRISMLAFINMLIFK